MNKINYDFKNRTAIVTGGAQGFGLDIAKRFLDSGGKVIIWDIDQKMIEKASNQLNSPNFLNNTLSSSVAYSKRIPGNPSINMSINANLSQNSNTKSVNLTLPTFQGNMDRIFPFEPKDKPKKGLIQNSLSFDKS